MGSTGITGPTGPAGIVGATGPTGPAGVQGNRGPDGVQGIQGVPGDQGIPGIDGRNLQIIGRITGIENLPPTGNEEGDAYVVDVGGSEVFYIWYDGAWSGTGIIQGPQGVTGPRGLQGLQGIQGVAGVSGIQGSIGATGPSGPSGTIGATGATGPSGVAGASSYKGSVMYTVATSGARVTANAALQPVNVSLLVYKDGDYDFRPSGTADNALVVPAGVTRIRISGGLAFVASSVPAGTDFHLTVRKNGSISYPGCPGQQGKHPYGNPSVDFVSGVLQVTGGDVFTLVYGCATTGQKTPAGQTHFQMEIIA